MFGFVLEASYERNSHTVPYTVAHHYTGNLENWQKYAKGRAVAVCTMGDSRALSTIIQQQVDMAVTSPPYIDAHVSAEDNPYTNTGGKSLGEAKNAHLVKSNNYGTTANQLGNLPPGDLDSIVASPPYATDQFGGGDNKHDKNIDGMKAGYGTSDGQLGSLKEGSLDALVSSSPFADSIGSDDPDKRGGLYADPKRRNDKNLTGSYGQSEGQLGMMKDEGFTDATTEFFKEHGITTQDLLDFYDATKDEEFDASIGSPPFADSIGLDGGAAKRESDYGHIGSFGKEYGNSSGQLGSMSSGDFDLSVSSPSFAGNTGGRGDASRNGIDPALFDRSSGGMKRGTGESEDNLDHLSMKGFDSAISSPPYADTGLGNGQVSSCHWGKEPIEKSKAQERQNKKSALTDYGTSDNQLGNSTGPTFWQAAKDILLECHKLLRPNAVSFWVCKNYVKSGRIVDFVSQWLRLCEVCGFEHIETIIAWQTEDKGTNFDFEGEKQKKVVRRQSFFRLLHIKNHPELAIDCEIVLVMRKHL